MAGPAQYKYTAELWDSIIERLWAGDTATQIARDNGISDRVITNWSNKDEKHKAEYKAAMEGGARAILDEVIPIVDNREDDKDPSSRKVRAWARLEIAKRKAPHLFGDKVTLAGDPEAPLYSRVEIVAVEASKT